jgi:hemerythrin-like domain-containing protein
MDESGAAGEARGRINGSAADAHPDEKFTTRCTKYSPKTAAGSELGRVLPGSVALGVMVWTLLVDGRIQPKEKPMPRKSSKTDALAMLKADHDKVRKMFKEFEKLEAGETEEKAQLVKQACVELKVHTQVENEIVYPAIREAIEDDDLMDEALVEHEAAEELIAQLEQLEPGDEMYDAKFTVLGEYVNHHIAEEQKEMFPKARKARIDLVGLGEQMAARKRELTKGEAAALLE